MATDLAQVERIKAWIAGLGDEERRAALSIFVECGERSVLYHISTDKLICYACGDQR